MKKSDVKKWDNQVLVWNFLYYEAGLRMAKIAMLSSLESKKWLDEHYLKEKFDEAKIYAKKIRLCVDEINIRYETLSDEQKGKVSIIYL